MDVRKDVIGAAIQDYASTGTYSEIRVHSDLCDEDVIEVPYLFRELSDMPEIEQIALNNCKGHVLDVGAAAGIHSKELIKRGLNVTAIDISTGAVDYLNKQGIEAREQDFLSVNETYDTILLLMNGIGIAGNLGMLAPFLKHASGCLNPGGRILCDSTDVHYLYEEEDGSLWVDLNSEYEGNFRFQMTYKDTATDWFDWLYVDYDTLKETAHGCGLNTRLLYENDDQFLVELTCI